MPEGGTITIAAAAEPIGSRHSSGLAPGDYLCVSVTDSGTGMDKDTLKRAVEPFFSTKGVGKGTGLGLSMVDGLAAQLGGAMTISSQTGLGTRVDLWLQLAAGPAEAQFAPPIAQGRVRLVADSLQMARDVWRIRRLHRTTLLEPACEVNSPVAAAAAAD